MVLRYSEWVYLLIGLAVTGFVGNLVAVIVLYSRLEHVEQDLANAREPDRRGQVVASEPAKGSGDGRSPTRTGAARTVTRPEPKSEWATGREPEPATEAQPVAGPRSESEPSPATGSITARGDVAVSRPPPPWKDARELQPLGSPHSASEESLLDRLREQLEDRRALATPDDGEPPRSDRDPQIEPRRLLDAAPLTRLVLLEEAAAFSTITAAHLLDPEPRIVRRAIEILADRPTLGAGERGLITPLVLAAVGRLRELPRGPALLESLGVQTQTSVKPQELEIGWQRAQHGLEDLRKRLPLVNHLDAFLADSQSDGTDLLLTIDTTRSMEVGLAELKATCTWLLPAIEWGTAGVRVGLLLYKDEIVGVHDFSTTPAREILSAVLELRPEGGADVPEGVDTAVRAALELGRFSWRPEARKHVVVVGDAPPRHEKLRGLKSLLAACRSEGGFRVHVLGVDPKEGGSVPFFAELAREGGGRGPTCKPGELGMEVLLCLLGDEARDVIKRLESHVKGQFSLGG